MSHLQSIDRAYLGVGTFLGRAGVADLPWIALRATIFLKSIGGVTIFSTDARALDELEKLETFIETYLN